MAGFDLAAVLGEAAARDTGSGSRERIEYIDHQRIIQDSANFYSLDGIEELAANIELVGLQQPIRVKKLPPKGNFVSGFRVVSGHRRLAAWRKLASCDPELKYRKIPVIVEPDRDEPKALEQLRLIYANSDTRKMTGRDLQQQAERIKALLTELKENGYEFKGRMRDQVAQICGVSKSKLSRLDAIKNNLHTGIYNAFYQTAEISETAAYEISKLPMKEQSEICRKLSRGWRPTTEKILQYIEDRKAAKEEVKREVRESERIPPKTEQLPPEPSAQEEEPEEEQEEDPEEEVYASTAKLADKYIELFAPMTGLPQWQTGAPPRDGLYYCRILIEGTKLDQVLVYREQGGMTGGPEWTMKHGYAVHGSCEILGWWPLPEGDL